MNSATSPLIRQVLALPLLLLGLGMAGATTLAAPPGPGAGALPSEDVDRLRKSLQAEIMLRRDQHERRGIERVRQLDPGRLAAVVSAGRLDPHDPDPSQRAKVEAELVKELSAHPSIAPFLGFPRVNGACQDQAVRLVGDALRQAEARWMATAASQVPSNLNKMPLAEFADPARAAETLAREICRLTQAQMGFRGNPYDSLPEHRRKALLEQASTLGKARSQVLVADAMKELARQAGRQDFHWPTLDLDSMAIRDQRIAEAKDALLKGAGIVGKARLQPLEQRAGELATAWFEREHTKIVKNYETSCLGKLAQFKATVEALKKQGKKDPQRVPTVPLRENSRTPDEHLKAYVRTVMQKLEVDPERAARSQAVYSEYATYLKRELVEPALKEYESFSDEILRRLVGQQELGLRPPGQGQLDGRKGKEMLPGDPGGLQVVLQQLRERDSAIARIRTVANRYFPESHSLTAEKEHSKPFEALPPTVRGKLLGLVGQIFRTRTDFQTAVARLLSPREYGRHILELEMLARQHNVDVEPKTGNVLAIDTVTRDLMRDAGLDSGSVAQDIEDYAHSVATQMVQTYAKQLEASQERAATILGRQRFEPILGPGINPGAFSSEGIAEAVQEAVIRRFPAETAPVRDAIARDYERRAKDEARKAEDLFNGILRQVFWGEPGKGNGPERQRAIGADDDETRQKAIVAGIVDALKHRSDGALLAEVAEQPEAKLLIEEQAQRLFDTIRNVPGPGITKQFKESLDATALGAGGLPSRKDVLGAGSDPERTQRLIRDLENTYAQDAKFSRYLKGKTFQDLIAGRAGALLARAKDPQVTLASSQPPAPPSAVPQPRVSAPPPAPAPAQPGPPARTAPAPSRSTAQAPRTPPSQGNASPGSAPPAGRVAAAPPPRGPKMISCVLRVHAPDASDRCNVTFVSNSKGIKPIVRGDLFAQRDTKSHLQEGVRNIRAILDEELPNVILAAFKESEGQEAQFNVQFEMVGTMVPQGLPRMLIAEMDGFFRAFNQSNKMIKPNLTEVVSMDEERAEGGGGKGVRRVSVQDFLADR